MIDYDDGISGISQNIMTNPISQSKESYIFTGALINKQNLNMYMVLPIVWVAV